MELSSQQERGMHTEECTRARKPPRLTIDTLGTKEPAQAGGASVTDDIAPVEMPPAVDSGGTIGETVVGRSRSSHRQSRAKRKERRRRHHAQQQQQQQPQQMMLHFVPVALQPDSPNYERIVLMAGQCLESPAPGAGGTPLSVGSGTSYGYGAGYAFGGSASTVSSGTHGHGLGPGHGHEHGHDPASPGMMWYPTNIGSMTVPILQGPNGHQWSPIPSPLTSHPLVSPKPLPLQQLVKPSVSESPRDRSPSRVQQPSVPCGYQKSPRGKTHTPSPMRITVTEAPPVESDDSANDDGGGVFAWAVSQRGCRQLQQMLRSGDPMAHESFEELQKLGEGTLRALALDPLGNYVVQIFLSLGTPAERDAIVADIEAHVMDVVQQQYGARVVQRAFETCPEENCSTLLNGMLGDLAHLLIHSDAVHAVTRLAHKGSQALVDRIAAAVLGCVAFLSRHASACRVVQKLLDRCSGDMQSQLVHEIALKACVLAKDAYGNYCVQHALELAKGEQKEALILALSSQLQSLSTHKFGSHVLEKLLQKASPAQHSSIVDKVCEVGKEETSPPILAMVRDRYSNYVVQALIAAVEKTLRRRLIRRIVEVAPQLRSFSSGFHICEQIMRVENLRRWPTSLSELDEALAEADREGTPRRRQRRQRSRSDSRNRARSRGARKPWEQVH